MSLYIFKENGIWYGTKKRYKEGTLVTDLEC